MQTQSHFLMAAGLRKLFKKKIDIPKKAVLWGSIAPDLSLCALSLGGYVYFHFILKWSQRASFQHMFGSLYFENMWWIGLHNTLHSPTMLLLMLSSARFLKGEAKAFKWFIYSCFFHSIVDVFTHVDDGPLLFFPFNWSQRFQSPISYWDPNYYGREFALFETGLDLFLIAYVFGLPLAQWGYKKLKATLEKGSPGGLTASNDVTPS